MNTILTLKRGLLVFSLALFGCLGCLFVWGLIEAAGPTTTRVEIAHPQIPAPFTGFSIAFLSDFHFGPFFSLARAEEVVARTNHLAPDLILLGGDYTDAGARPSAGFFKALGRLHAPAGVYAVLGNDDYKGNERFVIGQLAANGIVVLENDALWLKRAGSRIKLGGVREMGTWRYDLAPTLRDAVESDFVMLLVHQPDFVEVEKDPRLDLVFAGHTHGGQVNIFGWSPYVPSSFGDRFRQGVIQVRRTTLVVSRGLGTIILPIRVGSPPEIMLVTLKRDGGLSGE